MILQKVIFEEKNRNGTSVDDFYYRGLEEKLQGKKGTGVRALAADFIRQGRILDRFLILDETGCKLEIYTFFKDEESFSEFINHPQINPDFIYLDGPDQFKISGRINNLN